MNAQAVASATPETTTESIHEEVRARYAQAAQTAGGGCCAPDQDAAPGPAFYSALEKAQLPDAAVLASRTNTAAGTS